MRVFLELVCFTSLAIRTLLKPLEYEEKVVCPHCVSKLLSLPCDLLGPTFAKRRCGGRIQSIGHSMNARFGKLPLLCIFPTRQCRYGHKETAKLIYKEYYMDRTSHILSLFTPVH